MLLADNDPRQRRQWALVWKACLQAAVCLWPCIPWCPLAGAGV